MKHIHHIVPKHMGGTDDASNLIELSIEDHAEAHRILYLEYHRWQDFAAWQTLEGELGYFTQLRPYHPRGPGKWSTRNTGSGSTTLTSPNRWFEIACIACWAKRWNHLIGFSYWLLKSRITLVGIAERSTPRSRQYWVRSLLVSTRKMK